MLITPGGLTVVHVLPAAAAAPGQLGTCECSTASQPHDPITSPAVMLPALRSTLWSALLQLVAGHVASGEVAKCAAYAASRRQPTRFNAICITICNPAARCHSPHFLFNLMTL